MCIYTQQLPSTLQILPCLVVLRYRIERFLNLELKHKYVLSDPMYSLCT